WFRAVTGVGFDEREAEVTLSLGGVARRAADGCLLHPAVMDAALQGVAVLEAKTGGPVLPFALETLVVRGATPVEARVRLRRTGERRYDVTLRGLDGAVRAEMRGLTLRPLKA